MGQIALPNNAWDAQVGIHGLGQSTPRLGCPMWDIFDAQVGIGPELALPKVLLMPRLASRCGRRLVPREIPGYQVALRNFAEAFLGLRDPLGCGVGWPSAAADAT